MRSVRRYEFKTFSVGMVIPAGVQEREDQLRSELRIRGKETIKSQLAREIAEAVVAGHKGKKKVDRLRPDITVLVDLDRDAIGINAKSVFIYGMYTKPRGVSQRRVLCESCDGRGCEQCRGHRLWRGRQHRGSGGKKARRGLALPEDQVHVAWKRGHREPGPPTRTTIRDRGEKPHATATPQALRAEDG